MPDNKLQFSPDYTPEQLKAMGVYGEVYGPKDAPRLASLPQWPKHWYNEADPHGWLQWYNRYSKGRRIDDDERQIKRWNAFKARHGGKMFQENPTPRRAFALRNWAIDPVKLIDDEKKRRALEIAMEEYRDKKYKIAADMEWTRQAGGVPELASAFDFVKNKAIPGMQQAAFNFGGKAYDAVANFIKPQNPPAPGGVANAFKPKWDQKIPNALALYKKSVELKTSVPGETPEQLATRLASGNINKQQFFQNAKQHKWNIPGVPFANTVVQNAIPRIQKNPQPYLESLKKVPKQKVVDIISKNPGAFKMVNNSNTVQPKIAGDRPGLWDNIRAKRARGEKPAKPGDKGYPDKKQWKRLTSKKAELLELIEKFASSPAWQRSAGKSPEGGLNAKGRASYKRETGGTLKAPVTEKKPTGERAKRQNSFCSRMCGMKRVNTGAKAKSDPDSRINKALRKWRCKCGEQLLKFAETKFKGKASIGKRIGRQLKSDRLGIALLVGAGLGGISGFSESALAKFQLEMEKEKTKSKQRKKQIDEELKYISIPAFTLGGAAVGAGLGGYMQGDMLRFNKKMRNRTRDFRNYFRSWNKGWGDWSRQGGNWERFRREPPRASVDKAKKYFNIEKIKTKDEAKNVYRDLVKKHHPDKGGDEHTMKEINNHWDQIKHSDWFQKLAFEKLAALRRSILGAPKHVQKAYFENPALHKRMSSLGGKAPKAKKKPPTPKPLKQTNFNEALDAAPYEEGLKMFQEGKDRIKRADVIKFAKSKILQDLLEAKKMSDNRDFVHKNELLRKLVTEHPKQFKIDSHLNSSYVGLTHKPTGFKIHAQKKIIPSELLTEQ